MAVADGPEIAVAEMAAVVLQWTAGCPEVAAVVHQWTAGCPEVAAVVHQWTADCPEADAVQKFDCYYGRIDLKPAGLLRHHQPRHQK